MPRISAPTLAEHQARQRRALIEATMDILASEGVGAVSPATVGRRAGLARSSVYQYFDSTESIIATAVEEAFTPATAALAAALAAAKTPEDRIDAYVHETLSLAEAGAHRAAAALARAELPPVCRSRLAELHAEQARPLLEAVSELGVTPPGPTAELLGGLIQVAMRQVESGMPTQEAASRVLALIHHGLVPTPATPLQLSPSPPGELH